MLAGAASVWNPTGVENQTATARAAGAALWAAASVQPGRGERRIAGVRIGPMITRAEVLNENKKVVLGLTLDAITVTDEAVVFTGRATVSWKGRQIKDAPVACDEPD